MNPEVSIYCTVKNAEETLPATLRSVAEQRAVSWELVLLDDGSSDRTLALLRSFARVFPDGMVRIIPSGGIGRGAALNRAWAACRADYLANIDADDLFHPHKLALQLAVMRAYPAVQLLATDSLYIGAAQSPRWPELPLPSATSVAPPAGEIPEARDITALLGRFNPVNHSSVMIRRAALERVGGYNAERRAQLDYDLWIRLAAAGCRLHQLDLPLSAKRLHAAQSFEGRVSASYIFSSFVLQNRAIRALGLPPRYYALSALRVPYRLLPRALRRLLALPKRVLLSRPAR
ncbi:MAG: glycosyltransferase [Spirochaetaceae bacterium]|nr:MAG: glycosyltransferase [Spirochaetaceae bacterium]